MKASYANTFFRLVFSTLLFCVTIGSMEAQQVRSAIGARLGYPLSASYKHFISEPGALEATLGFRPFGNDSYSSAGLAYLYHVPLELEAELAPLHAYFGAGAHALLWQYNTVSRRDRFARATLGLSAYVGLQYAFADSPLELTIDASPTLYLGSIGFNRLRFDNWTLGVRYILDRQ